MTRTKQIIKRRIQYSFENYSRNLTIVLYLRIFRYLLSHIVEWILYLNNKIKWNIFIFGYQKYAVFEHRLTYWNELMEEITNCFLLTKKCWKICMYKKWVWNKIVDILKLIWKKVWSAVLNITESDGVQRGFLFSRFMYIF